MKKIFNIGITVIVTVTAVIFGRLFQKFLFKTMGNVARFRAERGVLFQSYF